jgi:tape measure domain-containing protein
MNNNRTYELIFRGIGQFDGLQAEMEELLALNLRLQNQNLENARLARTEATARKQLADEAKQAAQAQIAAELGLSRAMDGQKGLIEELRSRLKLLKAGREQANDVASINKYTEAMKISQKQLDTLTGATDKFKGSNGFWRDMQGWVVGALAGSIVTDWTSKIFAAQTQIEGFKLSLNRLVGEQQATKIFTELTAAIAKTPLEFEGATKGVEKLIFAYQDAGKSTKNIVNDFIAFGNVAKGNEENLKGITKGLADTAAAGKATAQEFNQFSNAGVNLFQLLAESTGMSRKELLKFREDGKISFDMIRDALIKAGSEGGRFFGAMTVQSQTVGGKISNFKDVVFQSMGAVGNQFADVAKKIISFGTTTISSLFGTESQAKRTIDLIKTGVVVWASYEVATRASAAATVVWNGIQKASLIIKGELILLTRQQSVANITLTDSELAAAAAAQTLNNTLLKNPFGLIVLAIGSAVAAYQLYSNSVEAAQEEQKKFATDVANAITPLKAEQSEFNNLTKSVLDNKLSIDERNKSLDKLKEKFPEQMKGINNLKDAEQNLGSVIRATNNDFVIRAKLLENEVRIKNNLAIAERNIAEKLLLESQLKGASTTGTTMVVGTSGQAQVFKAESKIIKENIALKDKAIQQAMKYNQNIAEQSEKVTKKLIYNYKEETKTLKIEDDKKKENKAEHKKDIEKIETVSADLINSIRADFRALNAKEDKKGFELQIKQIEAKYKVEVDAIQKSKKSYSEKNAAIVLLILSEEKELATVKNQIEKIKIVDELHKKQAKTIKDLSSEIVKNGKIRNEMVQEEEDHAKELLQLEREKKAAIEDVIGSIVKESKAFFDYRDATNAAKDALQNYSLQKEKLKEVLNNSASTLEDIAKQEKKTNEAQEASVKSSNQAQALSYQLLAQIVQQVFESVKKAIVNSLVTVNNALIEANKIYQDFAKEQREAELTHYEQELDNKLSLTEGNYDSQLIILKEYLGKAQETIDKVNISDQLASEFQAMTDSVVKNNQQVASSIENLSLNPIEMYKGAFRSLGAAINKFTTESTESAEAMVNSSQKIIEKLTWQRDNTVEILDRTLQAYKDKYSAQTDVVKEELSKQVDFISDSLEKNLSSLSTWYDAQRDKISTSYQNILDNNVRYTDTAFEEQLGIWNSSIDEQESLITGARDSQTAILKEQYESGKISLVEYTTEKTKIEDEYGTAILALRTKHYDELNAKLTTYTNSEKSALKKSLDDKLITQEEYDGKLSVLDDITKQRSTDVKAYIKADRDADLLDLKTNYLDVKVLAEQDAATKIEDIKAKSQEKLTSLDRAFATQSASIEKERYDTILSYNSQIFEQRRSLALAQAKIAYAQARAEAWSNPLTALFVLPKIKSAFQEVFDEIGGAGNPFAGEIAQNQANDSKDTPVVTPEGEPQKFFKGTSRVNNRSGKSGIDTEDVRVNVGERITQTHLNDMLRNHFGRDIPNEEVVFRTINSTMPIMDYKKIANFGMNVSSTADKELLKELKTLNKVVGGIKNVDVNIHNGHPTMTERSSNRMIKYAD